MTRVYLSRHGHTHQNEDTERSGNVYNKERLRNDVTYQHITSKGESQARRLGKYLKRVIADPQKVLFVTSSKERTHQTARIVAQELGVELSSQNHYTSGTFDETLSLERALEQIEKSGSSYEPREVEWLKQRKPEREIGEYVNREFQRIVQEHSDKVVIPIFHQNLNNAYLRYLGIDPPTGGFGNAAIYELQFEPAGVNPVAYWSNEQLTTTGRKRRARR